MTSPLCHTLLQSIELSNSKGNLWMHLPVKVLLPTPLLFRQARVYYPQSKMLKLIPQLFKVSSSQNKEVIQLETT